MSLNTSTQLYPNGAFSISLRKQPSLTLQSDWIDARSKKVTPIPAKKINKLREDWYDRPQQWRKLQQCDHEVAAFDNTREEFEKYPWLHQYDNLNTEPTAPHGLGLGEDLSQKLQVLQLEAKQEDGSHASIFKGSNHKPYGCDGLNYRGKRSIESMGVVLEQLFGKENIGFVTLTLPWFGEELMAWISSDFPEITKRYFEKVKRYFKSIGEEFTFVRVTEIQPQRWKEKNQYALHIHYSFVSRNSRMWGPKTDKKGREYIGKLYYLDFQTNDRLWQDAVWNSVRRYEAINGVIDKPKIPKDWGNKMQDVHKSVAGYLSKYMSKGGQFLGEVREWIKDKKVEGYSYELPKRWWGSSKNLVELLKKHIVPIPEKLRNKLLAIPEGFKPAPGVIYKVCPTFYSEKLQKDIVLAHCGKIIYKEAIKHCFKKQEKAVSHHPLLQVDNLMQYAKAMRYGGQLVKPEECDYESHKKLGLLCPNCSNPVFLVKSKKSVSKLGKEFTVPAYFSHYNMTKSQIERCELRVKKYSEADIKRAQSQARNQRVRFFQKWFWSIVKSAKVGSGNRILGPELDFAVATLQTMPNIKYFFEGLYSTFKELVLTGLDYHLDCFVEGFYRAVDAIRADEEKREDLPFDLSGEIVTQFNINLHRQISKEAIEFLFIKMNRELANELLLYCSLNIDEELVKKFTTKQELTAEIANEILDQLISIICFIPWTKKFEELS